MNSHSAVSRLRIPIVRVLFLLLVVPQVTMAQVAPDTVVVQLPDDVIELITPVEPSFFQGPGVLIAIGAILAALIGAFASWLIARQNAKKQARIAKTQAQIARLDRQLGEFFEPLLALSKAGDKLWDWFTKSQQRSSKDYFGKNDLGQDSDPTEDNLLMWKLVMREIFVPLNDRREKLILKNIFLIEEESIPGSLLEAVQHIAEFRAVIAGWKEQKSGPDTMDAFKKGKKFKPETNFPDKDIREYAEKKCTELRQERKRYLAELTISSIPKRTAWPRLSVRRRKE